MATMLCLVVERSLSDRVVNQRLQQKMHDAVNTKEHVGIYQCCIWYLLMQCYVHLKCNVWLKRMINYGYFEQHLWFSRNHIFGYDVIIVRNGRRTIGLSEHKIL